MLTGADGFELIEVHQQIVCQRHLLVELIREVQMVQKILTKLRRQHTHHKSGLSASLGANQRRHALIAVKRIHLQPMGYSSTQPDGQVVKMLCADTRKATEELCHMVLSIPCGQTIEEVLNRIELSHLLRVHKLHDFRFGRALLYHMFALGTDDDAVKGLLRQRTVVEIFKVNRGYCRVSISSLSR